jgi:hypothetical protein
MKHDSITRYFMIWLAAAAGIAAGLTGQILTALTWIVVLVYIGAEWAAARVIAAQDEYIELLKNYQWGKG